MVGLLLLLFSAVVAHAIYGTTLPPDRYREDRGAAGLELGYPPRLRGRYPSGFA